MEGEFIMYCNNCGTEIIGKGSFCSKCGNKVLNIDIDDESKINDNTTSQIKQFKFIRHKSLGKLDLSHIISEITLTNSILELNQQKILLYFFKKKPIKTTHNISEIISARIKKTLDMSDAAFSIIFALIGFFNPAFFILAAILLWVGVGRKIELKKSNGETIIIPAENKKYCIELVEYLLSINNSMVVYNK